MRRPHSFLTLYSITALLPFAAPQLVCYPRLTAVLTDASSVSTITSSELNTSTLSLASLASAPFSQSGSPVSNIVLPTTSSRSSTGSLVFPSLAAPVIVSSSTPQTDSSSSLSSYAVGSSSTTSIPIAQTSLGTFLATSLQSAIDAGHSSLIFDFSHTANVAPPSITGASIPSSISMKANSSSGTLSPSSARPPSSSQALGSSQTPSPLPSSTSTTLQAKTSALLRTSVAPSSSGSSTFVGGPPVSSSSGESTSIPTSSTQTLSPLSGFLRSSSGSFVASSTYLSTTSSIPVIPNSNILTRSPSKFQSLSPPTSSTSSAPLVSPTKSSAFNSFSSSSATSSLSSLSSFFSLAISISSTASSSSSSSSSSSPSSLFSGPVVSTSSNKSSSSSTTLSPSPSPSSTTASLTSTSTSTSTSSSSSYPTLNPSTGKRGLAYGNNTYTSYFAVPGQSSHVAWAYNYFSLPATTSPGLNPALAFVPMLFNSAPSLTSVFAANVNASIAAYGTDSILAFNEPDSCFGGSACMSVSESVAAYKTYIQPFAGRVLLGAPAVTNGGSPGSLTYLANFLGNCTGCTVDFVPIHWYASAYNEAYFQQYVAQAYNVSGGRPLWVTEFGMDQDYYDPDVQTFIQQSLVFLDSTSYVQRYAYFGTYPNDLSSSMGYPASKGLLVNNAGTGLSAEGVIFNT